MDIGIISCVSKKKNHKAEAQDLYISPLFKKSLHYCLDNYDKVFILSAKYGLVQLTDIIEPYDLTLNNFNVKAKKQWSYKVYNQLHNILIQNDIIYWHCGINYRKYLMRVLKNKQFILLKGLSIGKQLQWYKQKGY